MNHPDKDLAELQRLLWELPVDQEAMSLSEFDGFCYGVLLCPDIIMPSEWLPEVWGEGGLSSISNITDAERIIGLVMEHYNRVASNLVPPCKDVELLFVRDPNSDDYLWEPWVLGFQKAMRIRGEAWERIAFAGDEDVTSGVGLILELHQIDMGTSDLDDEKIEKLDEVATDLIPEIVLDLNTWVKGQTGPLAANIPTAPAHSQKVGRNEQCPCGSGRKYKKCCGAN